jgi:hypothetical protein
MKPAPVGTRIRVLRNDNNHTYRIGGVYTIVHDDHDGTFKASDEAGKVGNWLRWEECEPAAPSTWDRIAADLPEEIALFLACFDGIGSLTLKEQVIDTVLAGVPHLHERIVAVAGTAEGQVAIRANLPQKPADWPLDAGTDCAHDHDQPQDENP